MDAAVDLLAAQGFPALGINPLAERAGVDKQLIYRYFGGLDGVVAALGARLVDASLGRFLGSTTHASRATRVPDGQVTQ